MYKANDIVRLFQESIQESQTLNAYFDMDGVIADFVDRYNELYPDDAVIEIDNHMDDILKGMLYPELKVIPAGKRLVGLFSKFKNVTINILSSTGHINSDHIKKEKLVWLRKYFNNVFSDIRIVSKSEHKVWYSKSKLDVLIDDRSKCINFFNDGEGKAFLFDGTKDSPEKTYHEILKYYKTVAGNDLS